jgi:uncharacterized protein YecT (DUF1311 family)
MNEADSPCAGVGVTLDLANCLARARDLAKARLDSIYEAVSKRLDAGDLRKLEETQRLWIQYRDANCRAERDLYEGTAASPAYLACTEAMTRARTKELGITYAVRLKLPPTSRP